MNYERLIAEINKVTKLIDEKTRRGKFVWLHTNDPKLLRTLRELSRVR